jgi:predicted O-methyltransferase YrrM
MSVNARMNSAKYAAVHLKEWIYTLAETRARRGRLRYGALISEDQRELLETSVRATEGVPGDVIECGIFRGGSTLLLCDALSRLSSRRRVFAVDAF